MGLLRIASFLLENGGGSVNTVDGRNPAPVEVGSLSHHFTGFYTFQVVQDFNHQQYE